MVAPGQDNTDSAFLWGRLSALGLVMAMLACAIDQTAKLWLYYGFGLTARVPAVFNRFLDLELTFNTGISYGLFAHLGPLAHRALLGFEGVVIVVLWVWLARTPSRLTATALGLIIGGAIGNLIDRLHWPGVMDFIVFHLPVPNRTFWVFNLAEPFGDFNLADAAIVAGVLGLLYESLFGGRAAKAP